MTAATETSMYCYGRNCTTSWSRFSYAHPWNPPRMMSAFRLDHCRDCSCQQLKDGYNVLKHQGELESRVTKSLLLRHQRLCDNCAYSCRHLKLRATSELNTLQMMAARVGLPDYNNSMQQLIQDGPKFIIIGAQKESYNSADIVPNFFPKLDAIIYTCNARYRYVTFCRLEPQNSGRVSRT